MEDLLATRQPQDILQIDRVTIYRMLEDGRLRGVKVGGKWRNKYTAIVDRLSNQAVYLSQEQRTL
jgi:excisionase family DNA binding protein